MPRRLDGLPRNDEERGTVDDSAKTPDDGVNVIKNQTREEKMAFLVGMGSKLKCDKGAMTAPMIVTPENMIMGPTGPLANIMDNKKDKNIPPFGPCSVLKGVPCNPVFSAPWAPGSPTLLIAGKPAVDEKCQLACSIGGVVKCVPPPTPPTPALLVP